MWTDASAPYRYNESSRTFHQHQLAAEMLAQLRDINGDAVAEVTLASAFTGKNGVKSPAGSPVLDVIRAGLSDASLAVPALDAVLAAISAQTK